MGDEYVIQEARFEHVVLEGSSYEVGRAQAEILKQDELAGVQRPQGVAFYTSMMVDPPSHGFRDLDEMERLLERHCPGLADEIRGFADGLGVPLERSLHYLAAYARVAGCIHWAVLPAATADGHVYVGRSYELNPDDEDLRLCATRIVGKAPHVGFSTLLLGRLDGINGHGLVVTMSAGVAPRSAHERERTRGFDFWVAVRALLDNCGSVGEALDLLDGMPLNCYNSILVADRAGHAALVEVAGTRRAVKQIGPVGPGDRYLVSTDYYTLPEMIERNSEGVLARSQPRYRAVVEWLEAHAPAIGRETIRTILSRRYPDGCCCPYYSGGVGTLWSMILDVTEGDVEVSFGAPTHNQWRRFGLDDPAGVTAYRALFPSVKASDA